MTKVAERFINKNVGFVTIAEVTDEHILFSNGSEITFDHPQDCCEWNYADFKQIEDIARNTVFTLPLQFEEVDESGFRFGNPNKMFFIPCYSDQNGYYTTEIDIYYDNHKVLEFDAEYL